MAVKCEMCGSPDLVKDGDYFECKHCGCKYTVAEIKKQMGVVTVTVDQNDKIDTLMKKGDTEFSSLDYGKALETYNKVLEVDSEEPVALCRVALCNVMSSSVADLHYNNNIIPYYLRAEESLSSGNYNDYPYKETKMILSKELVNYIIFLGNFIHDQYEAKRGSLTTADAYVISNSLPMISELIFFLEYGYCAEFWPSAESIGDLYSLKNTELIVRKDNITPLYCSDYVDQWGDPANIQQYKLNSDQIQQQKKKIKDLENEIEEIRIEWKMAIALEKYEGDFEDYYQETKGKIEKIDNQIKQLNTDIENQETIIKQCGGAIFGEKAKKRKAAEKEKAELVKKKNSIDKQYAEQKALSRMLEVKINGTNEMANNTVEDDDSKALLIDGMLVCKVCGHTEENVAPDIIECPVCGAEVILVS